LKQLTAEMANDMIKALPETLLADISAKMDLEMQRLLLVRRQFPRYVKSEVQNWFEKTFEVKKLPGLEQKKVLVTTDGSVQVFNESTEVVTSADTLGTALLASSKVFHRPRTPLIESKPKKLQVIGITRIAQLLAHGGFNLANGQPFESL